jgi:hypothetical protein
VVRHRPPLQTTYRDLQQGLVAVERGRANDGPLAGGNDTGGRERPALRSVDPGSRCLHLESPSRRRGLELSPLVASGGAVVLAMSTPFFVTLAVAGIRDQIGRYITTSSSDASPGTPIRSGNP